MQILKLMPKHEQNIDNIYCIEAIKTKHS